MFRLHSGLMVRYFASLLALTLAIPCFGQSRQWEGLWEFEYRQAPHMASVGMRIEIGAPVSQMLYPCRLTLTYRDFLGVYNLLLVKKNETELAIARNKYPIRETPYSLGPWMMYLNGVFEKTSDDTMGLKRMWFDNFGVFMNGIYENELFTNDKVYLRDFLFRKSIVLNRKDRRGWSNTEAIQNIIFSDSIYYGIYDSFLAKSAILDLSIRDEERYDRDTVTIVHNGRILMDRVPVEQAMVNHKLALDSGQNYIAFFADSYGDIPPNTANFILTDSDIGGYSYDFSQSSNAFATLMVASIIYEPVPIAKELPHRSKKVIRTAGVADSVSVPTSVERTRRIRKIGDWTVSDPLVFLEFWDDQIEDGDSISILVNETAVQAGVLVKREPQRIGITLKKGINRIRFVADNEGTIPPNTAVLRAVSGVKSRLFYLNTSLDTDNILEIKLP